MPNAAPSSLSRTQQLADAYGEAWNAHGVVVGHRREEELVQVAERIAAIKREFLAEEFFVWEYTISAALARAFPIGDATGQPTAETAQFDTVDVIRCDQGKVTAKDTYLDGFAMWRGMHFSEPSGPPRK